MSITIFIKKQYTDRDKVILEIAKELFREMSNNIIGLESRDSWDGANLRIIVKDDSSKVIDKIMEIVYKEIERNNAYGEIIPEIVKASDLLLIGSEEEIKPRESVVKQIERALKKNLRETGSIDRTSPKNF